jgi:hypothetical protein
VTASLTHRDEVVPFEDLADLRARQTRSLPIGDGIATADAGWGNGFVLESHLDNDSVRAVSLAVLLAGAAAVRNAPLPAAAISNLAWSLFVWKVTKHVKSTAIVFARDGQVAAVGAGQMSRVDSAMVAAMKALIPLAGTVVGSDAYFPFADGLEEAAKHGATAVIQPGGSVRDEIVIAAANRLGLAMVFTGVRHFRH